MRRWLAVVILVPAFSLLHAQDDDEEPTYELEEVLVTGMKVTAGGAQDIAFARSAIEAGRIPHPASFTDEGLLSQHDLTLPQAGECDQLFCIFGEAAVSDLVAKPEDRYFVGLGFATNLDERRWRRPPLNLIAVVDKSGSMSGEPLGLVRRALTALAGQLGEGDQLGIVLYGDRSHVYLEPTALTRANRASVKARIAAIESAGSTNMEEGLAVGYRLARESGAAFEGATRVILFTDERPNVGETSAAGFSAMALAASQADTGLTTIGVGVQFDSELAVALSSTRGGNLFFLPDAAAADRIFADELDYMVSELAHDLNFILRPHPDLKITAVYGLPDDMLAWGANGAITFTIPTVFLSSRGGGVFVTLAASDRLENLPAPDFAATDTVLEAELSYLAATDGRGESHSARVTAPAGEASNAMQLASVLIDEFLLLRQATGEHFVHNNQEGAYQAMRLLDARIADVDGRRLQKALADEQEMVKRLLAQFAWLSGHSAEVEPSDASRLWGAWRIVESDNDGYYEDYQVGGMLVFSPDYRFLYLPDGDLGKINWESADAYGLSRRGLLLDDYGTLLRHRFRDRTLSLRLRDREADMSLRLVLEYAEPFPTQQYTAEYPWYYDGE